MCRSDEFRSSVHTVALVKEGVEEFRSSVRTVSLSKEGVKE